MIADRVKETTSTTGTGNLALLGATAQFQSFNTAFGTSTPFYYVITDANGADWEVGTGQLTNATTLQRTTVHQSSNADAKINLSSGTHTVFCAAPEVFLSGLAPKSGKLSQFAATTSAELAGVISDETGSGALVFATSPSLTTPSLGAATATSVNGTTIPSSKTLLVDGGALGTPSSGTVTNLTGTASININGTVGATTANTGAFTTLSATGNVNLDGGSFVFNEAGADKDFRIEGDTDANLFFTDASTDRVGIGTSSPGYKLHVTGNTYISSSSNGFDALTINHSSSNSIGMRFQNTYAGSRSWNIGSSGGGPAANGSFFIYDDTGAATRMVIDSSGNVGIGTSTPAARLETNVASGNNEFRMDVGGTPRGQILSSATDQSFVNLGTGAQIFYTAPSGSAIERMRIDSSGNVGIGTSSPVGRAEIYGATNDEVLRVAAPDSTGRTVDIFQVTALNHASGTGFYFERFYSSGPTAQFAVRGDGTIYAQNTTVQSISDVRVKENVRTATEGLSIIDALRPVRFDFKQGFGNNRKNQLGFIAQEVEAVFPDAVDDAGELDENGDPYKSMGPSALIPVLVKAIQELKAEIEVLKAGN